MFPCPICDVKLNSLEQRRAHCRGKNHIKREEARKKAEELGTDFDNTPNHCEVCNVPLTSKMTAIDHFKGKGHQKKVKAVEDQRQGFKNYCDICEVRLQSLKVSEAHFKGKQHCKRERKTISARGQGKKIPMERKSTQYRASPSKLEAFSSNQNIFGVVFDESLTSSASWENQTCDKESEPKDLLSEFRNSLNGKSLNSPDTPSSSSPDSLNEPFFSFEGPAACRTPPLLPSSTTTNHTPLTVLETSIPRKPSVHYPPVRNPTMSKNGLDSFYKAQDFPNSNVIENTPLDDLWDSPASCKYSNEKPTVTFPDSECLSKSGNGVATQSELLFMQTQKVVHTLREAGKGISSGNIAVKIAGLSPSDVNLILSDLEKNHLVSKSGYAPILWSVLDARPRNVPNNKNTFKPLNGFPNPETVSSKETQFFNATTDSFFNQDTNMRTPFTTTETYGTTPAISTFRTIAKTTAAPSQAHSSGHVIESNLVNLFQQSGLLTLHEIEAKLHVNDDVRSILKKLVERNVIVKDSEQRWRLVSSTRSTVGVIGEERKRRSPVQSEGSETSRERTPSPPKENDNHVQNGYETRASESKPNNGYFEVEKRNGFSDANVFRSKNGYVDGPSDSNVFPAKNDFVEAEKHSGYWQELKHARPSNYGIKIKQDGGQDERHVSQNNIHNRSSPPLPMKTETNELLEDLTVTAPKGYQRELYEIAMQEDTICYLPCGTGKDLVMAQVIAHMAVLNPAKQALVIVPDIVTALNVAQVLRKEIGSKSKRKKLNITLHAGQLKQSNGKIQVAVVTSWTCLSLLNCGALSWKDVCLLIFDQAAMCCNDEPSRKILQEYYLKAKRDYQDGHIPKLLSFLDSSIAEGNLEGTVRKFGNILSSMGDIFLSCVSECVDELEEDKHEAMFVCVQAGLSEEEARIFFLLGTYLNLVFDNLAAQWQPLNSYRELLKLSFKESSVIGEAFVKLIRLTGQPLEKRLPSSCLKTWQHYLAICEVIFTLVECGEDIAKELLVSLKREQFGFAWANDVGLPGFELAQQLLEKENWGSRLSNPRGSGVRELLEQLMIMQWENARVSSERPLAIVIVKLNKTAKMLANYLARCPELTRRNVKTTFLDGSRSHQQKMVISAIKRRQYQVIVSTDNIDDNYELPHCELVVLLDQPSSTYALEQLRTRRATNVVAICRDVDGEHSLKQLLRKEELVESAINIIRGGRN